MRRIQTATPAFFVAILTLLPRAGISPALAQERGEGIEREATAGYFVRQSLGFDMAILAALDVLDEAHFAIAFGAIIYGRDNLPALEPLAGALHEARSEGGKPDARERRREVVDGIKAAHHALRQNAAEWKTTMEELLSPGARAALANVEDNAGLDPLLCLLSLVDKQRELLWAATLTRNAVTRNPYKWHRTSLVLAASEDFDEAVARILSREQRDLLAYYQAQAQANLASALLAERDAYDMASRRAAATRVFPVLALLNVRAGRILPALLPWAQWAVQRAPALYVQAFGPAKLPESYGPRASAGAQASRGLKPPGSLDAVSIKKAPTIEGTD